MPKLVKTVVEDLALVLPSPTSMSPDMWQPLFSSLLTSLKELLTYNERYMAAIADENGPQAVGDSLDTIWKTFARRSDVDACRMWVNQVARYVRRLLRKFWGTPPIEATL
jgi:L-rhamnose isomerase